MRLLEAILQANHQALAGDPRAGVRPSEHPDALPLVVVTCCDPRMHPLMPEVLGVAEADFVWLTNAGNLIVDPVGDTARSVALACAAFHGREIAVIGHTDCEFVRRPEWVQSSPDRTTHLSLSIVCGGVDASGPGDERSNVQAAVHCLRGSPVIAPHLPVHGLLVEIDSGRLEWIVNGYSGVAAPSRILIPRPPVEAGLPPASEPPLPSRTTLGDLPPIGAR